MCASFSSISAAFSGGRGGGGAAALYMRFKLSALVCTQKAAPGRSFHSLPLRRRRGRRCVVVPLSSAHSHIAKQTTCCNHAHFTAGPPSRLACFHGAAVAARREASDDAASCRWEVTAPAARPSPLTPSAPPWPPQQSHHM